MGGVLVHVGLLYKVCKMCSMLPKRYERLPVEVSVFLGSDAHEIKEAEEKAAAEAQKCCRNMCLSIILLGVGIAFTVTAETKSDGMSNDFKNTFLYVGIVSLVFGVFFLFYCMHGCREFAKKS